MERESVIQWLDRYLAAWRSYDRQQIGELFSEDARCRYHPYDEPIQGRAAIVESWFEDQDQSGVFEAEYRPVAIDGETVVAVGHSSYRDQPDGEIRRVYDNCFVMRFDDDGRCADFTEWFVQRPDA